MITYFKRKWNEWKDEKQRRSDALDHAIWRAHYSSRSFDDVSLMTGRQFEEFLVRLFGYMGYTDIEMTPANDQGGDIICTSPDGIPTVIQAKRWSGSVGNGAVQEVLGAMRHYGCAEGIVVTNSRFTTAATRLVAGGSDVTLRDREWLEDKMREYLPSSVPDFDRAEFDEMLKRWQEMTRKIASQRSTRRKRLPKGQYTLTEALRYAAEGKGQELTITEIRRLAHLHSNLSDAETNLRHTTRRLEAVQARQNQLKAELAELDDD